MGWDVFLINLASKFGVGGAVVLSLLAMFLIVGTQAQHIEFIDKFFLLKFPKGDNIYMYFVLLLIVILYIFSMIYFRNRIKLKDERIAQLQADLVKFQDAILKRQK
jgi:hypothetical protein